VSFCISSLNPVRLSALWSGRRRNKTAREREYAAPSYTVSYSPISREALWRSFVFGGKETMDEDDNNGMPPARPEFIHVSEGEVWAAIENDDGGPIVAEATRLAMELVKRLRARAENVPECGVQVRVRCPIERVVVLMMSAVGAKVVPIQ
jgi:hypothetical protein